MSDPVFDYQFRLVVVGDTTVGKSSLLKSFTDARFEESMEPTIGADFFTRKLDLESGTKVKLQLWDTAGQERFRSITNHYFRNSVGVLLVYDITNRNSFDHLSDWLVEARSHIDPQVAVYVVIGHKLDRAVDREVTASEGQRFADGHGLRFFETSALTGENIEDAFLRFAQDIHDLLEKGVLSAGVNGWDGVKLGNSSKVERFELDKGSGDRENNVNKCCKV